MLKSKFQGTLAILCATLLAGSLLTSGCGRTSANPLAPDDAPASEEPAPGDGDTPEDPGYDDPTGGGGYTPAPAPGDGGSSASGGGAAPSKPSGGGSSGKSNLRPLPAATPTPAPKGGGGSAPNPSAQIDSFINLLRNFGYEPANSSNAAYNVKMQLLPLTRVPSDRFHWVPSDNLGLTYGRRKGSFPKPPASMKEWMDGGLALARRDTNVSWYVGRKELYQDIMHDRYTCDSGSCELVFYKRLNRTGYVVSYTANGQIDDYAFVPEFTWRDYIAVPDAILR